VIEEPDARLKRVADALDDARRELIDISRRNRLLHTPRTGRRVHCLEFANVDPDDVFSELARDGKAFAFAPEEENPDAQARPRTLPTLRARVTSQVLERRLLKFFREARVIEEEQGVNILFLVFGFLQWFEDERSGEVCWAPLILLPVVIERRQGREQFVLRARDDDLMVNVSLREKLRSISKVELPELPEGDDWLPSAYLDAVAAAVSGEARWEVDRTSCGLGFFTFSKFLMWRDLSPSAWPEESRLLAHPLVSALLGHGQGFDPAPPIADQDEPIDKKIDLAAAIHVLDADSSQALAVEEAKAGRNLVIQGPPGTGKSQTIANIIAAAVHSGRSVLFVAEKAAALDVVYGRLKAVGLEPLCLELHSRKATKAAVVSSLDRALSAGGAVPLDPGIADTLRLRRDRLNGWSETLHREIGGSGRTPYYVMGRVLQLHQENVKPLSEHLDAPGEWDAEQLAVAEYSVDRAAAATKKLGVAPVAHSWRGAKGEILTPFDADRLREAVAAASEHVAALSSRLDLVRHALASSGDYRLRDVASVASGLRHLARMPIEGRANLAHPAWRSSRAQIRSIHDRGRHWADRREELGKQVSDVVWHMELEPIRRTIAVVGRSPFRVVRREYRRAVAELNSFCRASPPKTYNERVRLLDELILAQGARRCLADQASFAVAVLGDLWNGEDSAWSKIQGLTEWAEQCDEALAGLDPFRSEVISANIPWDTLAAEIETSAAGLQTTLDRIVSLTDAESTAILGTTSWDDAPITGMANVIGGWQKSLDSYNDWIGAREAIEVVREVGLGLIADGLYDGSLQPLIARSKTDLLLAEALWRRARSDDPVIDEINGAERNECVESFRALDRKRIEVSRAEVLRRYLSERPTGSVGEMGVIRAEIGKKRRHLPIRRLLERAATAVQKIKPVFLMSPLSVAQFLPPGRTEFDLLVIDEASQVPPEDAFGAVARARQVVVVGDDKQLPPTNFFRMLINDDDETLEDDAPLGRTRDFESILTLARARGMPERMLRWHYRSRHPSLIALSNHACYAGSLLLPPSPHLSHDGLGLTIARTPPGQYDRGGTGRNPAEAQIVADYVERHLREHPDLSLGVACFSVSQRDAIEDALYAAGLTSAVEAFCPNGERLFVKSLETVQGDERDVVFISIGYGRDAQGRMSVNFGPVSADGGERRLNVLISRARQRCVVFSSIEAGDIRVDAAPRGTRMLREFLHFAETGKIAAGEITGGEADSPFEEAVARVIRSNGYNVVPQVGVSGFQIDLGVIDPTQPGHFVLGVECDGATYHSARSARDRDRLRHEVLASLGWRLHRIWSTDWFRNPQRETARLLTAIQHARASAPPPVTPPPAAPAPAAPPITQEAELVPVAPRVPGREPPRYEECQPPVPRNRDLLTLKLSEMAALAAFVVKAEGPIHAEEVARRIREAFGLGRTGNRILSRIIEALRAAERLGEVIREEGFWSAPQQTHLLPRQRRNSDLPLRRADRIAPREYRLAVLQVVETAVGIDREDLIVETARLLGFDRTGSDLHAAIEKQIVTLLNGNHILSENGHIRLPLDNSRAAESAGRSWFHAVADQSA
jgi:very-short-patch-repair endonuclease